MASIRNLPLFSGFLARKGPCNWPKQMRAQFYAPKLGRGSVRYGGTDYRTSFRSFKKRAKQKISLAASFKTVYHRINHDSLLCIALSRFVGAMGAQLCCRCSRI
jgi:hypothetical protein